MKNFKITAKEDNKEYWISRSCAVAMFVFSIINGKLSVLANKRGSGTPDYQGYWNCPCGYLDWDETLIDAAKREVLEETGYEIDNFTFLGINDSINENKQNITVRFYSFVLNPTKSDFTGGEENEVSEIKWIPVNELYKYDWAFNHDDIISNIVKNGFIRINELA